jgi:hypothetical protein
MALRQVGFATPAPEVVEKKGKKGGGGFGQAAGAVVGGVVGGMATGGAGAIGGAAGGASLGAMVGEKIKPTVAGESAMARRAELAQPEMVQSSSSEKIKEALMALHSQPPEVKQEYAPPLLAAYLKANAPGGGVA